jgi:uncharacterized protein DUF5330
MRKIERSERTAPSKASASVSSSAMGIAWGTKGRAMFFLIRTAFWLSIVIMLLPTPDSMKTEGGVGATQAISAASATMSDMKQFCIRQPDACEVGAQALTQFGRKAQASAKWIYEFLGDKLANEQAASAARAKDASSPAQADPSQNTLTAADSSPTWRGPQRQADAKR